MKPESISYITPNYVARQIGWNMTEGWMQGDRATREFFAPEETYPDRIGALLAGIAALGFSRVDLWTAHAGPEWMSDAHLAALKEALSRNGLTCVSFGGGLGGSAEELARLCRVVRATGADLLVGGMPFFDKSPEEAQAVLRENGCRWGFENHPNEKTAEDVLRVIDRGDPALVGAAVDTGWFGTNGTSASEALRTLRNRLMHVHLKDVRHAGAHTTCALGDGVVDVRDCVEVLVTTGYEGPACIEHEPEDRDPDPEIVESRERLAGWLEERS